MNTMTATKRRYVRPSRSEATRRMAEDQREAILGDARMKGISRRAHLLLRQLLFWHDPLTGHLYSRTPVANLEKALLCSDTTIMRARRELIAAGLLLGYRPGSGEEGSRYHVARSWEEAEAAAAARKAPDAPYFPEVAEDPKPSVPGAHLKQADEDQEPKADEGQAPEAEAPEVDEGQEDAEDEAPLSHPHRRPGRPRKGSKAPKEPLWRGPEKGRDPQVAEAEERLQNGVVTAETGRSSIAALRAAKGWGTQSAAEAS